MGSAIKDFGDGLFNLFSAKKNAEDQRAALRANKAAAAGLDWRPEYASEHAPKYEQTQSPVARSYLESMLTGNNSDLTFSGSPNAKSIKAQQDFSRDQMYGSPAAQKEQGDAWRNSRNYAPTPITRQVGRSEDGRSSDAYASGQDAPLLDLGIDETTLGDINDKSGRKDAKTSSHGLTGYQDSPTGAAILVDGVPQGTADAGEAAALQELAARGASQEEYDEFWRQADAKRGYKKAPKTNWNPFKR